MGKRKPREGSAEAAFLARLDSIEARGKKLGLSMPQITGLAGVARATPERWRRKVPQSVLLLDKLEDFIAAAERKATDA